MMFVLLEQSVRTVQRNCVATVYWVGWNHVKQDKVNLSNVHVLCSARKLMTACGFVASSCLFNQMTLTDDRDLSCMQDIYFPAFSQWLFFALLRSLSLSLFTKHSFIVLFFSVFPLFGCTARNGISFTSSGWKGREKQSVLSGFIYEIKENTNAF